jgi:hypothetical protein
MRVSFRCDDNQFGPQQIIDLVRCDGHELGSFNSRPHSHACERHKAPITSRGLMMHWSSCEALRLSMPGARPKCAEA